MKHMTDAFFFEIEKVGRRKCLFDMTEQGSKCFYVEGKYEDEWVSFRVDKIRDETHAKTTGGTFVLDSISKVYIEYVYARESGIPILRDFYIYGERKLKGKMCQNNGLVIPIISTISSQNIKKGTVETTDGEVFFLDWLSCNEKFAKEMNFLRKMTDNDSLFSHFLGKYEGLNLFPEDEDSKILLMSFLYQQGRIPH